jgi:hypothetical protein
MGVVLSAYDIKRGNGKLYRYPPAEGSRIRIIYDCLQNRKGRPVEIPFIPRAKMGSILLQLRVTYGMEILILQKRTKHQPSIYILVGEWFESEYRDYLEERFAKN